MTLASTSTIKHWILRFLQRTNQSRRPHISATKLLAEPICSVNPESHLPCSSLTTPPQPVRPLLPNLDPSVLSFFHPIRGLSHRIRLITLQIECLGDVAQHRNSKAWARMWEANPGFWLFPLKTLRFLLFQKFHKAIGKRIPHWKPPRMLLSFPLVLNHSWESFLQKSWFWTPIPS